ncbi:hypothetical protein RFI_05442, partial [Reticulomyxa filosa]
MAMFYYNNNKTKYISICLCLSSSNPLSLLVSFIIHLFYYFIQSINQICAIVHITYKYKVNTTNKIFSKNNNNNNNKKKILYICKARNEELKPICEMLYQFEVENTEVKERVESDELPVVQTQLSSKMSSKVIIGFKARR